MKKLGTALVIAGALFGSQAQAAWGGTDNSISAAATLRDGDTGFMIGGEGRPKANSGLAFAGDYLSEDFGPLTRTRFRAAFGAGHHFGAANQPQYAALLVGAWLDEVDSTKENSWYTQARYQFSPKAGVDLGANLTYTGAWDGGITVEAIGRYHFNKHVAAEASYTVDVDDVEGDDRIMVGLRFSHDWL